jgi:lysozyme family protein
MTDDDIINRIMAAEGGFVDNMTDRGGPTNFGITMATLAFFRGHPVTLTDIEGLTALEARAIYRKLYIVTPHFDAIANGDVRAFVVDSAVQHGVRNAVRLLQRALGVHDDGVLGPITLGACAAASAKRLYLGLCGQRVRFYGAIITHDPSQSAFALGWANRIARLIEAAPT